MIQKPLAFEFDSEDKTGWKIIETPLPPPELPPIKTGNGRMMLSSYLGV